MALGETLHKDHSLGVLRIPVMFLFVAAFNITAAFGDERTSPDGVIVVTAPDSAHFEHINDPPAPFIALWLSKDETLRLGVTKMAIPSNVRLIRSSTEDGFAEEIDGTVTASSSVVKNGHEIWIMTARGSAQGTPLQSTQAIAQFNGSLYKVMAAAVGDGPTDATTIDAFVNSIRIIPPPMTSGSAPMPRSDQGFGDGIDLHNLSKRIGGASALLLIVLVIWLVMRRGKPQP